MSSPLFNIFNAALNAMGGTNEYSIFLDEGQKRRMLMGLFDGYYATNIATDGRIAFDTNRIWLSRLPALISLFPDAKVICCVRNPAWVFDSLEQLLRRNALDTSRLYSNEAERGSVFSRADALFARGRLIGGAYTAFKEAFYGPEARHLLILDYDTLCRHPVKALVYQFLGEPAFQHDFENVSFEAEEFDTFLLAKGLHNVQGRVEARSRPTSLPPDLFQKLAALDFWTKGQSRAYRITERA